jgi:hypothetical protein
VLGNSGKNARTKFLVVMKGEDEVGSIGTRQSAMRVIHQLWVQ